MSHALQPISKLRIGCLSQAEFNLERREQREAFVATCQGCVLSSKVTLWKIEENLLASPPEIEHDLRTFSVPIRCSKATQPAKHQQAATGRT